MRTNRFRKSYKHRAESGQVMLFVLLALGIFLLGAMAFAVDLSNLWFNRQAAQTAADAACTAGAMDLLADTSSPGTSLNLSLPAAPGQGTIDCKNNASSPPCKYAALNGFSSPLNASAASQGAQGDNVLVTFPEPGSFSNLNFPGSTPAAPSNPIVVMQVNITNNIPTFFAGMLNGLTKQTVGAKAVCGVVVAPAPLSVVALSPLSSNSFSLEGDLDVNGGPVKGIQVNSSSNTATTIGGGNLDLCAGGANFCGSNMGVWGAESLPGGFPSTVGACSHHGNPSCSGAQAPAQWVSPNSPVADQLSGLAAPAQPTNVPPGPTLVNSPLSVVSTPACPDEIGEGCEEFSPGYYPNGICVGAGCNYTNQPPKQAAVDIAIFDPGLYYIKGGIHTAQASGGSFPCLRPGPPTGGDGSGGTVFYLADAGSVAINANCNEDRVDTFPRAQLSCPGVAAPSYFPGTTEGVVLLGPCQAPTVQSLCDPNCNLVFYNNQRGILFFQNRASDAATLQVQDDEDWVLGGAIYFHQCVTSGVDTGIGCSTSAYNDSVTLLSGGGQGTVFGTIIADQISLTGPLTVDLNSTVTYPTLKATLLQ